MESLLGGQCLQSASRGRNFRRQFSGGVLQVPSSSGNVPIPHSGYGATGGGPPRKRIGQEVDRIGEIHCAHAIGVRGSDAVWSCPSLKEPGEAAHGVAEVDLAVVVAVAAEEPGAGGGIAVEAGDVWAHRAAVREERAADEHLAVRLERDAQDPATEDARIGDETVVQAAIGVERGKHCVDDCHDPLAYCGRERKVTRKFPIAGSHSPLWGH